MTKNSWENDYYARFDRTFKISPKNYGTKCALYMYFDHVNYWRYRGSLSNVMSKQMLIKD